MSEELELKKLELALKAKELELKKLELEIKLAEAQTKMKRSKRINTLLKPITAPIAIVSGAVNLVSKKRKSDDDDLWEDFDTNDLLEQVPADLELAKRLGLDSEAVLQGQFVGCHSDLVNIIKAGEDYSYRPVNECEISKNSEAVQRFLARHTRRHIPYGYKIHYIRPLNRGGKDDPDNMIIVSNEQFARIQTAQRFFYSKLF